MTTWRGVLAMDLQLLRGLPCTAATVRSECSQVGQLADWLPPVSTAEAI